MSEWHTSTLLDIVELIGGGTPKTSVDSYWNGDIPWLSVKDFNNNKRYVYSTEKHISQEGLENSSAKLLQKDDIIISARGTVGELAMISSPMAFNQSCYGVRGKRGIDQIFLYYLIKNSIRQLKAMTHGSVFDTITRDTFSNILVSLPDIKTQRAIALLLSNLDDKIEENELINQNLEQQAIALFKSWFIDFDLFNGVKPNEWESCLLGEVTNMCAGGDKPKAVASVKSDTLQYPIYSNGLEKDGLYGYTDVPKINEESVTVSARGTIGFVCLRHVPYVPIVRLIALVPNSDYLSAKYLYLYLKQLNITGTGTTQQQLTVPDFKKTEILIPDKNSMSKFTEIVSPLFDKIWANEIESQNLAQIRDVLLPQLMSGELDVSDFNI